MQHLSWGRLQGRNYPWHWEDCCQQDDVEWHWQALVLDCSSYRLCKYSQSLSRNRWSMGLCQMVVRWWTRVGRRPPSTSRILASTSRDSQLQTEFPWMLKPRQSTQLTDLGERRCFYAAMTTWLDRHCGWLSHQDHATSIMAAQVDVEDSFVAMKLRRSTTESLQSNKLFLKSLKFF